MFPLGRGGRDLHLEFFLLVSNRLFRPRGGGEAAAAHLVARGRGAVLSGAAAIAVGAAALCARRADSAAARAWRASAGIVCAEHLADWHGPLRPCILHR